MAEYGLAKAETRVQFPAGASRIFLSSDLLMSYMKGTVLAIVAHNDDNVIGAGGSLAKLAKEGYKVKSVVFSYGESSHPHLKKDVITRTRYKESLRADKIIGGSGIAYLEAKEGGFLKDKYALKVLKEIVQKEKPKFVFTHSLDDPHPDHRAVYHAVIGLMKEKILTCPVFSFEIWNPLRFRGRNVPKMIIDISDTFEIKIKSILVHESQKVAIGVLFWNIWLKAKWYGWKTGHKYAEIFYKVIV